MFRELDAFGSPLVLGVPRRQMLLTVGYIFNDR